MFLNQRKSFKQIFFDLIKSFVFLYLFLKSFDFIILNNNKYEQCKFEIRQPSILKLIFKTMK